ncbi:MAG: asparagine synthase (glutamine-hydrolyzing) [Thermoflexales bacterium]|nr:asparagine synthase (glutamine-hydrolyzing) [Thermoflexales bacterium]
MNMSNLRRATTLLRHRGPDDEGYVLVNTQAGRSVPGGGQATMSQLNLPPIENFADQDFDLAFGFRRLAILDLSAAGHQPMSDPHERYWIVFNGEIYNYLALRAELSGLGYSFQSRTDTEVVLAAYQHWGTACLPRLNGMWALAIWDKQERCLFLARDRFGIKPLYYARQDGALTFASEIKALVGKHGIPFQADDETIYRYLVAGDPPPSQERTYFKGVLSLPPGQWLRVGPTPDRVIQQRYWDLPELGDAPRTSPDNEIERYRDLLIDTVRLHLQSDVLVGTCLSGGLDSSSIVWAIRHLLTQGHVADGQLGERLKTFSAVYDTEGRYNERSYIQKVLDATGVEGNFTFPTVERLRADLEQLVWHQEHPFGSLSVFAQWCVMSKARECGVTVLLDGQGADEALGGYRPFEIFLNDVIHRAGLWPACREARAIQAATCLPAYPLLARSLVYSLPSPVTRTMRRQHARRQADRACLQPDFALHFGHQTRADWFDWSKHATLDRHLRTVLTESSLPFLLHYEDRNAMAFSVEARVPFLDHRLVEFAFAAAAGWRIHQGWTKWILRKAMQGRLPDEIVWRRDKVGFEVPEGRWLRRWLRAEPDMLGPQSRCRDYLRLEAVHNQLASWQLSNNDKTLPVWPWINLEMWLRTWSTIC